MKVKFYTNEGSLSLEETGETFFLKNGLSTISLKEVSIFPEERMWELDKRFGEKPEKQGSGYSDYLEFEEYLYPLIKTFEGKDEYGMPFALLVYSDLFYLETGPLGEKSILVLKSS